MEQLHLGVGREIITPKIGCRLRGYSRNIFSEKVEDDLTATAFYFTQGEKKALMVSITLCNIRVSLAEALLEEIEKRFSVPKECCMLSCVHTHSGPDVMGSIDTDDSDFEYRDEIFIPRLFSAIEKAVSGTQPVKVGVSFGNSLVGVNRREITLGGRIKLGQNPWGCFDPRMTVISFKNEKNECVANMVHYACHNTAAGQNHEITRDWCGVMTDALERFSGGVTAFFNGPEGDVGPRLSNGETKGDHAGKKGDIRCVYELGGVASCDAVRIFRQIYEYNDVCLRAGTGILKLPLKKRLDEKTARELLTRTDPEREFERNYYKRVIAAYEAGAPEEDHSEIGQRVIAFGNVVFASFPFEMFSEVGLRVQKEFTDKTVLCLALTNGANGYFATQDAVCRGGYEVERFKFRHVQEFCDDADESVVSETVRNIKTMI